METRSAQRDALQGPPWQASPHFAPGAPALCRFTASPAHERRTLALGLISSGVDRVQRSRRAASGPGCRGGLGVAGRLARREESSESARLVSPRPAGVLPSAPGSPGCSLSAVLGTSLSLAAPLPAPQPHRICGHGWAGREGSGGSGGQKGGLGWGQSVRARARAVLAGRG